MTILELGSRQNMTGMETKRPQGRIKTNLGLMLLPRKRPIFSQHSRPTKMSNKSRSSLWRGGAEIASTGKCKYGKVKYKMAKCVRVENTSTEIQVYCCARMENAIMEN